MQFEIRRISMHPNVCVKRLSLCASGSLYMIDFIDIVGCKGISLVLIRSQFAHSENNNRIRFIQLVIHLCFFAFGYLVVQNCCCALCILRNRDIAYDLFTVMINRP